MKSIFGIDFDDTLVDFNPHWQQYHLREYGVHDTTFWTTKEGLRRGHEFVHSHYHEMMPAIEGAIEAVETLKRRHKLVIITARDIHLANPTIKLLEKHFPKMFQDTYFLHKQNENILGTKGDVCKRIGATKFIDDAVKHVESTRDLGITSFLFTTDANKHIEVPGIIRVNNWKEVVFHTM